MKRYKIFLAICFQKSARVLFIKLTFVVYSPRTKYRNNFMEGEEYLPKNKQALAETIHFPKIILNYKKALF